MHSNGHLRSSSTKLIWTGRILSALVVLLLLFDSSAKLMRTRAVMEGTMRLGYSENLVLPIGVILLICVVLYAFPATSVLGAIFLTGYLGGAVASNLRAGEPLLGFVLFPVYVGILVWGGLFLRDSQLRALIPVRRGW